MIERELEIENQLGLHARAAAKLVHLTGRFDSAITVEQDGERVDAKSILGVLLLAAPLGSTLTVRCDGRDEEEAIEAIAALLADKFGEGE